MKKTISEEYQKLNRQHHISRKWGVAGGKWIGVVDHILKRNKAKTVFDYGAGQGVLSNGLRGLGYEVTEYDPGIEEKSKKPEDGMKFDFVISTDVFEHIEEEFIDNVLDEIKDYIRLGGFFVICLGPAKKHWLADGRNAHVLVKPRKWWLKQLTKRFNVVELPGRKWVNRELVVRVKPKKDE